MIGNQELQKFAWIGAGEESLRASHGNLDSAYLQPIVMINTLVDGINPLFLLAIEVIAPEFWGKIPAFPLHERGFYWRQ